MKELVKVMASALVSNPDAVEVEEQMDEDRTIIKLHVAQDDMGRVIGRQGRIAKAIRTIVKATATRENKKVSVDIE
ncbi:MAG: KH domain-containing protein [Selenomonadaceae bacterium]|nr:KH domain-containing protein [Selenomonadaceae bacterium]MBR1858437.1 KH domain-containing protein [Selenomonadaceae bacterium]